VRSSTVQTVALVGVVVALGLGGAALGVALSGAPAASSAVGVSGLCAGSAPKLTVQGLGNASATPNLLTVTIDVDVTDPGAQASLTDDDNRAAAWPSRTSRPRT